tara:strand:- start:290 stop:496 length:207 start_codon:yes stop_codon:yes gene_type:complete
MRQGSLVECETSLFKTGLVIKDPYMAVFTVRSPNTNKTTQTSEMLAVDVLVGTAVYKKVPVNILKIVR